MPTTPHPERDRALAVVRLDIGAVRMLYRDDVDTSLVEALKSPLLAVLYGDPIVGPGGWTMSAASYRGACAVTLSARGVVLATVGVTAGRRGGWELWEWMHAKPPMELRTDPGRPPPTPWCAVRLERYPAPPALRTWVPAMGWAWRELRGRGPIEGHLLDIGE